MSWVDFKPVVADYQEGTSVQAIARLIGGFFLPDDFTIDVFESGTNILLGSLEGTQQPRTTTTYLINLGTMPNHTLNLQAKLTVGNTATSRLSSVRLRPPSILVENISLNPDLTQGEVKTILEDAGISEEKIAEALPLFPEGPKPQAPGAVSTVTESKINSLPWYASWIEPVISYIGTLSEAVVNYFGPLFSPLGAIAAALKDPFSSLSDHFNDFFTGAMDESTKLAVELTSVAGQHSPEWSKNVKTSLYGISVDQINNMLATEEQKKVRTAPITPAEAWTILNTMKDQMIAVQSSLMFGHAIVEAGSLGQFEFMKEIDGLILSKYGLSETITQATMLPVEKNIFKKAEYYVNNLYVPEIPDTTELINEVVKEVLPYSEFEAQMRYKGFSREWSKNIWDAHFIAPSLGQILTSWRRGHIKTEDLDKLEILVDLDPRFKLEWNDMRYVDPSIMAARFMFETNAIDKDGVKDIVKRNGLFPDDIDAMTNYIVTFQERLWRRRYIMAVATGYRQGVYDAKFLTTKILEAGYTEGVANWMIQTENVRSEIAKSKVKPEKDVLVTLTIAIDAYINDDVDEAWLRNYFYTKGYDAGEIDIALKVYNRKKASKKPVSATI